MASQQVSIILNDPNVFIDHVRAKAWHFITSLKYHVKMHPPFFEGKKKWSMNVFRIVQFI